MKQEIETEGSDLEGMPDSTRHKDLDRAIGIREEDKSVVEDLGVMEDPETEGELGKVEGIGNKDSLAEAEDSTSNKLSVMYQLFQCSECSKSTCINA